MYGCVDGAAGDSWSEVDDLASSSAAVQVTNPGALYTVVSRNRTAPSQTNPVTASGRSSWTAGSTVPGDAGVDTRQDLYTRVIRRQEGRRTSPAAAQSLMLEPGASVGLSGYGYSRIDESLPQQQNYGNNAVDFYDVIRDDLSVTASSDFDPNYETVPQTTVTTTVTSSSISVNGVAGSVATATVSQQQHGSVVTASVVVNDSGSLRQSDSARHRGLLIREHIYDEVSSPTTTTTATTTTTCTTTVTHTDV